VQAQGIDAVTNVDPESGIGELFLEGDPLGTGSPGEAPVVSVSFIPEPSSFLGTFMIGTFGAAWAGRVRARRRKLST
jgi:hypothetical protein